MSSEQQQTSSSSTTTTATTTSTSRCPIDHGNSNNTTPSSLWKVFGWNSGGSGMIKAQDDNNRQQEQQVVASLEEAAKYAQVPHPEQRLPLSTARAVSSIPRGETDDSNLPHHQPRSSSSSSSCSVPNDDNKTTANPEALSSSSSQRWVYPSEQQVFNAMKRKGWNGVEETAIPSFLQIHNYVNEMSWRELCKWEEPFWNDNDHGSSGRNIKLVRFQGRPNTLTPKAWILSTLFFQERPFDRHDWYIDNGIDHEKRYVLDFYMKNDSSSSSTMGGGLPRVEVDVRPALDTPQALVERGQRLVQDMVPGITKALKDYYNSSQHSSGVETRGKPSTK